MTTRHFDLNVLEELLLEPMRGRLAEARTARILHASHYFWDQNRARPAGEAGHQAMNCLEMATEAADGKLESMGRCRLTSPVFWNRYQAYRDRGLTAHRALEMAMDDTRHLVPVDLGRRL